MTAVWDDNDTDYESFGADSFESDGTAAVHGRGGRVLYGMHAQLEEAADALIFGHLRTITSRSDKADVLTPWKIKNRIGKEVYSASGFPEPSIRNGMFHRCLNRAKPGLNSRDGLARAAAKSEHSIAMKHFTGTDSGSTDG